MKVPTVRDIMQTKLVTLTPELEMEQAINLLLKHKISGASVVGEHRKLVGVLSEKDCLRIFASGAYNETPGGLVSQYMSREPTTIGVDCDLFTAASVFLKQSFRRLPVVDGDGVLIGQVSRRDVLAGSREIWAAPPEGKRRWTDSKYIPDQVKAALD